MRKKQHPGLDEIRDVLSLQRNRTLDHESNPYRSSKLGGGLGGTWEPAADGGHCW